MPRIWFYVYLVLLLLLSTSQQRDTTSGSRLLHEAEKTFETGKYDEALQQAQSALSGFRENDARAGECLLLLGYIFLEKGDFEGAQQQFQTALTVFKKTLGENDPLTAKAINGLGEYFYKKNDSEQAESQYKKALQIRLHAYGDMHESVADSYNNLGNCQVQKGQYEAALTLHQKALDIRRKLLPADHPDVATSNNNLGNCYLLLGNYPEALRCFETALRIRRQVFGSDHPKTAQILNNLGNCYAETGRRSQAARYFQEALEIRRRHFGPSHPGVASALENIGDLYFDTGDYIAALDAFRQAYDIQRTVHPDNSAPVASLQQKMGLCYQYEGNYDKALALQSMAVQSLSRTLGAMHPSMAGLYNNLGNCYAGQKDYARAIEFYNLAERIYQTSRQGNGQDFALLYNNLGTAWLEMNEAQTALTYFEKAAKTLPSQASPDLSIFLKNKGLAWGKLGQDSLAVIALNQAVQSSSVDPAIQLEVLSDYGALLCRRGIRQNDNMLLRQAVAMLEKALQLADSLRLQLTAPASRQRWLERQYPVHTSAVEACFHLWQQTGETAMLERAFSLAERSRSLQLLESLHKEQAERFTGVPDSLLENERYWGEELNRREKNRLAWLAAANLDEARKAETSISEAREALRTLVREIEQKYPEYYRLKYTIQTADVSTVRATLLTGRQALVEYFVADSAIFVFIVTQDNFQGIRLNYDFPLENWVSDLRNSMQAYPGASGRVAATLSATYADRAFRIFQAVFEPVKKTVQLPENLILVPDGPLSYLPFEALLREMPAEVQQFKRHAYLLRDYRMSYGYSATQLTDLQTKEVPEAAKTLLALAPDFKENPYGLKPLQYNRKEAKQVCRMLNGDLLDGKEATVQHFTEKAGDYQILLLSTHGQASSAAGDLSYLAFAPSQDTLNGAFLYVRDLYLQRFPAELVVLSACETSVGEYRLGEGVISLAKGFFHAGAHSIVATLWSVDDAKNAKLIRLFFECLRKGLRKDEALRDAKLRFLDEVAHDEAHPVFWAAPVANGDMTPMELPGGMPWGWIAAGAAVLAFAVFWWRRRRKSLNK